MHTKEALLEWLEHERFATSEMLRWLSDAPESVKFQPAYARAVTLAWHICNCRVNWLARIAGGGIEQVEWWEETRSTDGLAARFADTLDGWQRVLEDWEEDELSGDFEYGYQSERWRFNRRFQAMQMVGHGFYHRGQIALLLTELGVEVTDTDFLFWKFPQNPDRWGKL